MSFSQENGYIPASIESIMENFMGYINTQFQLDPAYTVESFVGTNAYKFFYAIAQKLQENEVKTSEIFLKLQSYFDFINTRISRPVVTNPGIIEKLLSEGYASSVKPMIEADAGKIHICVDVIDNHSRGTVTITSFGNLVDGTDDTVTVGATAFTAQAGDADPGDPTFQAATSDAATAISLASQINAHATANTLVEAWAVGTVVYIRALEGGEDGDEIDLSYEQLGTGDGAAVSGETLEGGLELEDGDVDYDDIRAEIFSIIKDSTIAGAVTQGIEIGSITLSNGQSFDFKFNLPNRIAVLLRLTIVLSENNQVVVGDPTDTKTSLLENIQARYNLGKNFEPQRYFSILDAPWAASVLLEWSINAGADWSSSIYEAGYDDLFDIGLEVIELVET